MKILLRIMPCSVDLLIGLFFFISAKRMADSGASSFNVAATMSVWAVFYAATAYSLSHVLNRRNMARIMLLSELVMIIANLGMMCMQSLNAQYLWMMCNGIGTAMFFPSFQMLVQFFSRPGDNNGNLEKAVAGYTFSWSLGMASGPFTAAIVWGRFSPEKGWLYCYVITLVITVVLLMLTLWLSKIVSRRQDIAPMPAEDKNHSSPESSAASRNILQTKANSMPDIMKSVLILEFLGYVAVTMMRTYLPDYCTRNLQFTTFEQGAIMAVISYSQAFSALLCGYARTWHFRPWIPAFLASLAAIGMLVFGLGTAFAAYILAALLLGMFAGIFCFMASFHALYNTADTPRYISWAETIVGVTSFLSPLFGGWLATLLNPRTPFIFCSILLYAAAALYIKENRKTCLKRNQKSIY